MEYSEQIKTILTTNPNIFLEILLEKNQAFQLSAEELVVLQYLWLAKAKQQRSLSHQELADLTHLPEQTVRQVVMKLITNNYIHLITSEHDGKIIEAYDLAPLVNKCFETDVFAIKPTNTVHMFVEKVEHEFARKLSPIEIQYIQGWIFDHHVSVSLLEEALKETVLAGVRNFKYMNAIINNWQNNAEKNTLTKGYRGRKEVLTQNFSVEEKEIAEFDWERALSEDG